MAEERNEMSGEPTDTAEIKSEIERTRVEMSETLGEIQERLRPDHLIQQAKETVTDAATGKVRSIMDSASETAGAVADQTRYAGRNVVDYARMHPVQMAFIAGGLTWWMLRRGNDDYYGYSDDWTGASEGWQDHEGYATSAAEGYSSSGDDRSIRDRAGEYVSGARSAVGDYAQSARVRAREQWQRTSTTVDDWVHQSPMAAGLVALAVGAAIGMSVPSSRWEDRTMGRTRDEAWTKASQAARELKDTVTEKAQKVADTVMDVSGSTGTVGTGQAGQTATTSPGIGRSTESVGVSGTSPSTGRGTGNL